MYDQEDKHMKHASELIKDFESEQYNELLTDIYVDEHLLAYQNGRYIAALQEFIKDFGDTEVSIFSAPGDCHRCKDFR